jgi:hypothetical protein
MRQRQIKIIEIIKAQSTQKKKKNKVLRCEKVKDWRERNKKERKSVVVWDYKFITYK